ncbi:hypothetical protein OQA88_10944 [Cercophora sp. LCS_1]
MHLHRLYSVLASSCLAAASPILFTGGTIIAFDRATNGLSVIRNGSLLTVNDRITHVASTPPSSLPPSTETVDITGKILTPGFIDTHKHGWQTVFKTIASNTSLVEYFNRYGEFSAAGVLSADDVYISQLAGIIEAYNAGTTTILDHAHHTWSPATAAAGLRASVDSGGRIFWAYAFHNITTLDFLIPAQLADFRRLHANHTSPTVSLGIAYDAFTPSNPNTDEIHSIVSLAKELNVSVITTHQVGGPYGIDNSPELLHSFAILNTSIPVVFSHASFLSAQGAELLRQTNQFISITPESEFHYGHTHPHSHLIQDQASIGVDTHFTFSGDILTQTRIWLQSVRRILYADVLERWRVPRNNGMSVHQAFLLATRHGGLALRREDLGVIEVGAKADLVVWDGEGPALLGWRDPVAAVLLHASVGDVEAVVVDGKWVKRERKILFSGYERVKERFLESAKRVQDALIEKESVYPGVGEVWGPSGFVVAEAEVVDSLRGVGDGYGDVFLE